MNWVHHIPDYINAAFETAGAIFAWKNVIRIRIDKTVKGVYWPATAVFALWGYWNLFYYPWLDQWVSALCGGVLAVGNTVWVCYAARAAKDATRTADVC